MKIRILKGGFFTTVQDCGRVGFETFGVAQNGALDQASMRLANRLAGNRESEAVLEITMTGPEIVFGAHCGIAICGADISPQLNSKTIENNTAYEVERGDILSFGQLKYGCRAYLAISGSMDVPLIFGSKSTNTYAHFGGYSGRKLQKNDELIVHEKPLPLHRLRLESTTVTDTNNTTIRILKGPEFRLFHLTDVQLLLSKPFFIDNDSNRMGIRLQGTYLTNSGTTSILSSATVRGVLQVTPSGQIIVLMNDAGTTGGYPRIANCLEADCDKLAQLKPGDSIVFQLVEL